MIQRTIGSRKTLLALLMSVTVGLSITLVYLFDLPPFERQGPIEANEVCETLGAPEEAAKDIRNVVPSAPEYTFRNRSNNPSLEYSYSSGCSTFADGDPALGLRAVLMGDFPVSRWVDKNLKYEVYPEEEKATPFRAAKGAVHTSRSASVFVPCRAAGEIPGGQRNLSVTLIALDDPSADEKNVRQSLVNLAVSAARFAHKDAECSLPSKLPEQAPEVSS